MWTPLDTFGEDFLQELPALMPYILVVIALLVALILARLFVVLWAKKQVSAPDEDASGGASATASSESALSGIRDSFRAAMRRLKRLMRKRGYHLDWFVRLTGHSYRYELPWFAVVGEEGSGKTTLLEHLRLETPVSPVRAAEANDGEDDDAGCNWWFYNQALVLDVPGRFLYRPGRQAVEGGWQRVLKQLRAHRSRQPLNGIVLTISAADLAGDEALPNADIQAKATHLHNKLRDLQNVLGLRLPVYVVLTKADTVPGFRAFCEEWPDDRTDEMLGWSNPYAVDAAYTGDWVEEAFASLYDDLHYAQIRAISDDVQTESRDAFFLFPDLLGEMQGRLKTYLGELFTRSAYQEGFMLRGIYLTGDRASEANGQASQSPDPAFLTDLFQTKIFEEGTLVRPVAAARSWQQRATRAAQTGVVGLGLLSVFGLWWAGSDLSEDRAALRPSLRHAHQSIEKVDAWQRNVRSGDADVGQQLAFKSMATSLLRKTETATAVNLTTLLIPASWISDVEEEIEDAVAATYDKVILRAMRSGIRLRAENLLAGDLRSGFEASSAADSLTLPAMPSYRAWRGYTQDVAGLERAVDQYNGLTQTPNLDHFAHLAEYLFDVRIRSSLNRMPRVYRRALASVEAQRLDMQQYRPPATKKMRRHARRFNTALPRSYGVLARLHRLADQMDRLAGASVGRSLNNPREAQTLRGVRSGIRRVGVVLKNPESRWLTSDTLAMETVYGPFLAFADTSSLMLRQLPERLRSEARPAIDRLQSQMAGVRSDMTGRLLKQRSGRVQRAWSPDVIELRKALGALLDQPFMQPAQSVQRLQATLPQGRRLQWNRQALQQIKRHIQVYDSVTTKGLADFPPAMQRTVRRVASDGLSNHLKTHLGRAQSFVLKVPAGGVSSHEAHLQRRVDRFRRAVAPLNTVLAIQGELGMDASRRRLAGVVAQDAYEILQDIDDLLDLENLYGIAPAAFEQWQGRRSPNLAVLNARDAQGIARYLTVQRERMSYLAQDLAGPALSFLAQWEDEIRLAGRPLVGKWQNIRTVLQQHQNKTAGNTLSIFEDFLTTEMGKVRPVPYFLQTPADQANRQSSDFFLQKRNVFRRKLYERSRTLALRGAREGFETLASTFNQRLSGRFPFAAMDGGNAPDVPDAAPRAVLQFFRQYDQYASTYRPVLQQTNAARAARAFLQRMEALRPFFAASLDAPSTYPIPTVDVAPTFRVNRDRGRLGDQIIEWRMSVGGEQATYGRKDTLHWAAGDPVALRLRWAADAPTRPVAAEGGVVEPQARTVTYRYGGQWALLRLLRARAAPPESFDRRVDPDPHTLRTTVQVEGGNRRRASVYTREHLYRPGASGRIVLEEPFPRRAPSFSRQNQVFSMTEQ